MSKFRTYPSGSPTVDDEVKALGFAHVPPEEFLTPGLRLRELARAIGVPLHPAIHEETHHAQD